MAEFLCTLETNFSIPVSNNRLKLKFFKPHAVRLSHITYLWGLLGMIDFCIIDYWVLHYWFNKVVAHLATRWHFLYYSFCSRQIFDVRSYVAVTTKLVNFNWNPVLFSAYGIAPPFAALPRLYFAGRGEKGCIVKSRNLLVWCRCSPKCSTDFIVWTSLATVYHNREPWWHSG